MILTFSNSSQTLLSDFEHVYRASVISNRANQLLFRDGAKGPATRAQETTGHGHFTTGGIDDNIDSTLPPVRRPKMVPRS